MRRTHCGGRKRKEIVKGYSQNWIWSTKLPSYSSLCSSSSRHNDHASPSLLRPPRHGRMPAPHMGDPSMKSAMSPPPPGLMPVGLASGMGLLFTSCVPLMSGPPMMRHPTHPMRVPRNDLTRQIRRDENLFISILYYVSYFTGRSWCCEFGCIRKIVWQGRLIPPSYQRENSFGRGVVGHTHKKATFICIMKCENKIVHCSLEIKKRSVQLEWYS